MKTKSMLAAFILKTVPIIIGITVAFSSFIAVNAQSSVVGKWHEVSAKQFFTPEGAKQTGKSVIEKQTSATDKVEWEFKSDHTYSMASGHIKFKTVDGTWSVTGNQLAILSDAAKRGGMEPMIYTFSITGNTMIKTMIAKPPYNSMVSKMEDTSVRM